MHYASTVSVCIPKSVKWYIHGSSIGKCSIVLKYDGVVDSNWRDEAISWLRRKWNAPTFGGQIFFRQISAIPHDCLMTADTKNQNLFFALTLVSHENMKIHQDRISSVSKLDGRSPFRWFARALSRQYQSKCAILIHLQSVSRETKNTISLRRRIISMSSLFLSFFWFFCWMRLLSNIYDECGRAC